MKKSGGQESIPRHLDMDERKRKILVGYICLFISIHCVSLFQSKFLFAIVVSCFLVGDIPRSYTITPSIH